MAIGEPSAAVSEPSANHQRPSANHRRSSVAMCVINSRQRTRREEKLGGRSKGDPREIAPAERRRSMRASSLSSRMMLSSTSLRFSFLSFSLCSYLAARCLYSVIRRMTKSMCHLGFIRRT